ncbi:MAG: protein kinase [Planctomycetota bacterium]
MLSHYRVIEELGRGGMGFVFLAEDIKLKRPVALKVMNQRIASAPHSRRRFVREARAMAAVHHDNVATIFEVGESNQTPYMAMELLQGSTLEQFNKEQNQVGFETVIDYARQISRGLTAAHQRGIVHRDIKPANIWLETDKQRVKILDFGLALASTPVDQLAGRGAVIGTPGYLSPEQARSDPLDDRSDLYSLGVVLYELCTGQIPIQEKTVPGQLISILAHRPTPIEEINPEIPQPLRELVHCLLRKEPRSRPATAEDLLNRLDVVEKECHSKTEVAQAINKLKAGLDEVVQQKTEPALFSDPEIAEPDLSQPIESIPDPLANVSPVASMPATKPLPSRSGAGQKTNVSASTPWHVYLPIAAIAAVVLIALPVMTYWFSQSDGRGVAVVVTEEGVMPATDYGLSPSTSGNNAQPTGSVSNGSSSSGSIGNRSDGSAQQNRSGSNGGAGNRNRGNQARNGAQGQNGSQQNGARQNGSQAGARQGGGQRRNGNGGNRSQRQNGNAGQGNAGQGNARRGNAGQGQRQNQGNQDSQNTRSSNGSNSPDGSRTEAQTASLLGNRNIANGNANALTAGASPAGNSTQPNSTATGGSSPSQKRWTAISINEGRGADAMVQSGTTENFGLAPSIGVRRRGTVETNHSYLRFDFESMSDRRQYVETAELLLTLVGGERPLGSELRLYGVADVGAWPEEKLSWKVSFSAEGLQGLPLLAKITVSEPKNPERPRQIRIRSRELASFIANAEDSLVTIVLAGAGSGTEMVRFVSRDATSSAAAPRLRVSTPSVLPEKDPPLRGR